MRKNRGITLIALVITIIILLILAGISISALTGDGLFSKAQEAVKKQKLAEIDENLKLILQETIIEKLGLPTLDEYINMLVKKEIILESDIEIVDDNIRKVIIEDEFVYLIGIDEEGKIYFSYDGEKTEELNPKVELSIGDITNKTVDITINCKNNEDEIQVYEIYVDDTLVKTLETNSKQVVANLDTTFGEKTCYVIAKDTAENLIKSSNYILEDNTIMTLSELELFRDNVNRGNTYQGKTIELLNDIDLNGSESNQWIPIGNANNVFAGTFNGNDKVIKNIYIDTTEAYQGLFGYNTGKIQNLGIATGTLKVGKLSGGINGVLNAGRIENCYNNANINMYEGGSVGGIVGYIKEGAVVSKCYNTADVYGNITEIYSCISGIAGYSIDSTIEYCYNTGNIVATTEVHNTVASGISKASNSIIKSCYNTGDISISTTTGQTCLVATGIIGQMHGTKMYNCYNVGKTTVETTSEIVRNGGLTGYFDVDATMENCYWLSTVSPIGVADRPTDSVTEDSYEAIQIDTEEEMKQITSLLGKDYKEDTNGINDGYPILKWQEE